MQFFIYLALVIIGIYEFIKYLVNQSKCRSGIQYQELQNLVASALPGESGFQVAYGYYETTDVSEYTTRIRRTTYYRYAIAFRSDCLWVGFLGFEKKTNKMVLAAPMIQVRPEELGRIAANTDRKKETLILRLYHKDQSELLKCDVATFNRRSNRFRHVNIYQPQACQAMIAQMNVWAQRVNAENAEIQAEWKAVNMRKESPRTGLVLGMVSLIVNIVVAPAMFAVGNIGLSVITGPFGMLMGLMGLLKVRAANKSGAIVPGSYKILLVAAIIVSLLNLGFWWLYFTMIPPTIPPVGN